MQSITSRSWSLTTYWKVFTILCLMAVTACFFLTYTDAPRVQSLISRTVRRKSTDTLNAELVCEKAKESRNISNGNAGKISERMQVSNETCLPSSSWWLGLPNPELTTDLANWDFTARVRCPKFNITLTTSLIRDKIVLSCEGDNPRMYTSKTTSSSDVMTVPFGDQCLLDVTNECCTDEHTVPNVLHYVWYGKKEMGYFHFLSFVSGVRFMKPCLILVHGEHLPFGPYWDYFIQLSPNVVHVQRNRIESVYGKRMSFPEHGADVMRIEAVQKYGGLYLDFDQILLRPVDPLRNYKMTMGHVFKDTLGNQFIMAERNATFLSLWHQSYKNYKQGHWTWNSLITPYRLSQEHPELIHIDGYNFTRPAYTQTKWIFEKNYDWSTNYAMHLFIRWYKQPINTNIIRTLNTTIGAVSRHILFGNKELCQT